MKASRTKPIHPKVMLHYRNFIFSKKFKKKDFEDYFHLSERGRVGTA